jgi:hypothetical protein
MQYPTVTTPQARLHHTPRPICYRYDIESLAQYLSWALERLALGDAPPAELGMWRKTLDELLVQVHEAEAVIVAKERKPPPKLEPKLWRY